MGIHIVHLNLTSESSGSNLYCLFTLRILLLTELISSVSLHNSFHWLRENYLCFLSSSSAFLKISFLLQVVDGDNSLHH